MELKDLFLTPFYLLIIYVIAYQVRPKVTNKYTKKYFIPALTVKIVGAIGVGMLYFFYYGGGEVGRGDTFNYFENSSIIYQAFWDSPAVGFKVFTKTVGYDHEALQYVSRLRWYNAPNNYFVIQSAAFFGLLSFNTYTVIAVFFGITSFTGVYALYLTLIKIYPQFYKEFAVAVFFIPSLFFWGSGLMKDSICVGAIGWAFWGFYQAFIEKKKIFVSLLMLMLALLTIQIVKVYILLCFVPAAILWVFLENGKKIKNKFVKILITPILILGGIAIGYFAGTNLTEESEYSVENVAETAATTSNYLEKQTLRKAGGVRTGSSYSVGKLDGSLQSMLTAAPQAIMTALFRPFVFEVRNPVMFLSALECTWFIFLTITAIIRSGFFGFINNIRKTPLLAFCIIFSLLFGLGVGLTSGNFGTLVRYKVPLLPFFTAALLVLRNIKRIQPAPKSSVKVRPSLSRV